MAQHVSRKMGSRLRRFAPFVSLLALAACSGVLGIEDLHEGPAPGGAGSAGTDSNGGDSSIAGDGAGPSGGASTTTGGGSGGKTGAGGSMTSGGGDTGVGGINAIGGEAGEAGMGQAAAGGGTTSGTVTGHVIDFWGHKVTGIPVAIGASVTTTDAQGAFVIDAVPALYDVSLKVDFAGTFPRENYGYVYQGLTRRDPTLQVFGGLQRRSGNIDVAVASATPLDETHNLTVSLGSVDGVTEFANEDLSTFSTSDDYWRGPANTPTTAHALFWTIDANSLPVSFIGYSSAAVTLMETTVHTAINLTVAPSAIAAGTLGGKVTVATDTDRANNVYLRFTSGAKMRLLNDTAGLATFSYKVPTIANSKLIFAAVEGDPLSGNYGVVHKDGLAPNTTTLDVAIPTPAKLLTPADGATGVATGTSFSVLPAAGTAGPFVISMISEETYDGIYIITPNKQFKLPEIVGGSYTLLSTDHYDWRVETHGGFASVDAMSGPSGFMDEFSGHDYTEEPPGEPKGPRNLDGSFTISYSNRFTAE